MMSESAHWGLMAAELSMTSLAGALPSSLFSPRTPSRSSVEAVRDSFVSRTFAPPSPSFTFFSENEKEDLVEGVGGLWGVDLHKAGPEGRAAAEDAFDVVGGNLGELGAGGRGPAAGEGGAAAGEREPRPRRRLLHVGLHESVLLLEIPQDLLLLGVQLVWK